MKNIIFVLLGLFSITSFAAETEATMDPSIGTSNMIMETAYHLADHAGFTISLLTSSMTSQDGMWYHEQRNWNQRDNGFGLMLGYQDVRAREFGWSANVGSTYSSLTGAIGRLTVNATYGFTALFYGKVGPTLSYDFGASSYSTPGLGAEAFLGVRATNILSLELGYVELHRSYSGDDTYGPAYEATQKGFEADVVATF